ncbi:RNA polymerase sigma factor [Bacteroides pyogenes]|uniref:RNA polymerase sigma factor n=1 Tax=Bacteroides pyogenes TaxID=310300 RepID=UPI0003DD5CB4|nr:sigma-70 family RNA polymerase sigma factor [Bacteroides pyogenes]MBB3894483.1 RNA polymerase sigma factor (sigma-70 family) [Bacteroides pyogenes]GAE21605.1 RNA polymerase ECF-type sigma factor [Bacteroides pyogenes JCM 10003]
MYDKEFTEYSRQQWESFQKGDDRAFAWLYSKYIQHLYQYGRRFTSDTEMIKDCLQDVFVNVYKQRKKTRLTPPPSNIRIYLMSALRNSIFNSFNKRNLYDTYIANISYEFDLSIEDKLIETENEVLQKHTIAHLLNALSPRQREIIYYRFFEGLEYNEICELMNLEYQSAYNLLQRALAKLRDLYGSTFPLLFLFQYIILERN